VDALVVSGPTGVRTLTIDGAAHPYSVLLNAMSDGATLLAADGAILFGNRSFADIAGTRVETLRGSMFQQLVVREERASFEAFLRDGSGKKATREFTLSMASGSTTPVLVALSTVDLQTDSALPGSRSSNGGTVLMAIITDLTYRKEAEATRARLLERLISAEDDERRRVSRELHDETGQSLTALLVGLRTIADMPVRPEVRSIALRLRDVAASTVDDVGRLARGLHPAILDDMGLAAAARRFVDDYVKSFGARLDFASGDLDTPRLAPLVAATMYRILQETLTNVARHAKATNVVVQIERDAAHLELLVRDDGVGFEAGQLRDEASGLGLHGMHERIALLGGAIQIESSPGKGTAVRARIPVGGVALSAPRRRAAAPAPGTKRLRGVSKP
jgi:PAS domain S-box-containing protein